MPFKAEPVPRKPITEFASYLRSTFFIDADHPEVRKVSAVLTQDSSDVGEIARRLFYFVRDEIFYNPYAPFEKRGDYPAHVILRRKKGYCIQKAIVLAALARACGIPSRLRLADIRNHLVPPNLTAMMGTNLFYFHGYDELYLRGRWVKVTPTFDMRMCRRLDLIPVEFDGLHPALFHRNTRDGRLHVEYVRQRGYFADFPFEKVLRGFHEHYGAEMIARWREASRKTLQKYAEQETS